MKNRIRIALKHPLISGTLIVFLGANFANLFQFFFNLFMTRNLSSADYGILASLISLMTIATIPAGAFMPTIVRFAGGYFAKDEDGMLRGFFFKISKAWIILALILLFSFIIFSQQIGIFFQIKDSFLIILVGISVAFSFVSVVNIGFLQAKLSFKFLSFTNFIGALSKFIIGILLVYVGFAVKGALFAIFISTLLPFILNFIPLTFLFKKMVKSPKINNRELFSYSIPSVVCLFGLTSFVSMDIILVKHFFNPYDAGNYAVLSLISRIIFFLTAPISSVMFPIVVKKHTRNENYHNTFRLSVLLVLIPSILLSALYFLFPNTIIELIARKEFMTETYLLGIFGVYITVYSLFYIMANFYLSIKKTNISVPIIIGALLQAILIWFFHETFAQVILISFTIVGLLLVLLLVYYWLLLRKNEE